MEKKCLSKLSVVFMACLIIILLLCNVSVVAAKEKPIKLRFSHMSPPNSFSVIHGFDAFAKKIEEATGGKVEITMYPSNTLVKAGDAWEGAKAGVADISYCFMGYWPGMTPLSHVIALPGMPGKSAESYAVAIWKLYEKYPEIQAEWKDVHVLTLLSSGAYTIASRTPIEKVEDIKGLKVRATAGGQVDQMKALGAAPIIMPFNEVYEALQKGILDIVLLPNEAIYNWKMGEVAPHITFAPTAATVASIVMNKKKWDSLPSDIQSKIMSVSGLEGSKFVTRWYWDEGGKNAFEQAKKTGMKLYFHNLSKEEEEKWKEIGGSKLQNAWVEEMNGKGFKNAAAILEDAKKFMSGGN